MELELKISFKNKHACVDKLVVVEYEVFGRYEAASFDCEGSEKEIEFIAYDNASDKELPLWIVRQSYQEITHECWEHYKKRRVI